jgi:hypothetical protein
MSLTAPALSDQVPAPASVRPLSADEIACYQRDSFVVLRGFFSPEEIEPLRMSCLADPLVGGNLVAIADAQGNAQEVVSWTEMSDDLVGVIPRMARVVQAAAALIGRSVYHWHSKLSMKAPGSAGRWDWHQDYAYWYHEGCLFPDMATCTIAVDRAFPENGCLRLVKGSHHLGRIEHPRVGEASGVDPVRLEQALARLEAVDCEMVPGDALFFHSNTLHASGPNLSQEPRTLLHCSYNATNNSPFIAGQEHHAYRPIDILPDSVLREGRFKSGFDDQQFIYRGETGQANTYGYKLLRGSRPRDKDERAQRDHTDAKPHEDDPASGARSPDARYDRV